MVEYARNSTIRASSRAGSGPPNWADRPHTARALYSAQRAQCARHPEWAFPKGWPHWLPSPVAGRQSTVRARFGYPRTPRDGYVLVAPEGAPYTDLQSHGWRCAALVSRACETMVAVMTTGPRAALPTFRARDFFAEAQAAEESLLLPVAADSCAPIKQATGFPVLLTGLLKTPAAAASDDHEPQVGTPASGGIMAQIQRRLSDRPPPHVGDDEEDGLGSLIDGVIDQEESRLYAPRPSMIEPRLLTPVSAPVVFNHAHGFLTGLKERRGTAAADAEWQECIRARRATLRLEPPWSHL